jgi:hypothetical protein
MCSSDDPEVKAWISEYEAATGENQFCWTYMKFKGSNSVWKIIATVIVVAINQVLKQFLVRVVAFEKSHSLGEQMSSTAVKVFIAQVFNTAVLLLIMNADLQSPNLGFIGELLFKVVPKKKGITYSDFDQAWFANVGAALCMTMLIQNGTPPSVQCIKARLGRTRQDKTIKATELMRDIDKAKSTGKPATGKCGKPCCCIYRPKWWVRKCFANKAAYHQEALNESVEGPEFNLAASYGEAYLLIFVTLIYATGMPVLLMFAFFGFTYKYFADKWAILNFYKKPPMYGDQFYHMTQSLMPIAISLHGAFGVWTLANVDKQTVEPLVDRVTKKHVLPSLILLVTFVGYFVVKKLVAIIGDLTETPCERWYNNYKERQIMPDEDDGEKSAWDEEEENQVLPFSKAAQLAPGTRGAFLPGALKSYAIQDHPLYEDAFEDLKKDTLTEPALSPRNESDLEGGEGGGAEADSEGAGEGGDPPKKLERPTSASKSRMTDEDRGKLPPLKPTPPPS